MTTGLLAHHVVAACHTGNPIVAVRGRRKLASGTNSAMRQNTV